MTAEEQFWNSIASHPLTAAQMERAEHLRLVVLDLGVAILAGCPASRERSLAITNLEQALMWAVKSIALEPEGWLGDSR